MSLKNLLIRSLAICAVSTSALLATAPAFAQAPGFLTLEQAQPSDTTGKIEVLEFFAYTCSHCKIMEPMVSKWSKTLPENVVLRRVPVAFNASMADLQKLYYSLENMGRLDLHPAVFKALQDEGLKIFAAPAIFKWVASQGVDQKAFEDVFNSFGTQSQVTRADALAKAYQVEGTPTLTIGGKYVTSPSLANGYEASITQAQKLVEKVTQ